METCVSLLTPPGQGALATLGLRGSAAWTLARELFTTRAGGTLPEHPELGRFWFGRIGQEFADEGILAVRAVDPVPAIEMHVHGGREVVRFLVDLLLVRGARQIGWQEYLTQGSASWQSAALLALTQASTTRTAGMLLEQYHGAFRREIERIDVEMESEDGESVRLRLEALLGRAHLGAHLTTPFRVVVAGVPNVGKSSVVNALAGYARAIVSPIPGTTRDAVSTLLGIDGWPVELIDTAGLRDETDSLESAGIERTHEALESADLILWLVDATNDPVWPDRDYPCLVRVVNKIDLPSAWEVEPSVDVLRISATTGSGLDVLCERISRELVPRPPAPGDGIPIDAAQIEEIVVRLHRLEGRDSTAGR